MASFRRLYSEPDVVDDEQFNLVLIIVGGIVPDLLYESATPCTPYFDIILGLASSLLKI